MNDILTLYIGDCLGMLPAVRTYDPVISYTSILMEQKEHISNMGQLFQYKFKTSITLMTADSVSVCSSEQVT